MEMSSRLPRPPPPLNVRWNLSGVTTSIDPSPLNCPPSTLSLPLKLFAFTRLPSAFCTSPAGPVDVALLVEGALVPLAAGVEPLLEDEFLFPPRTPLLLWDPPQALRNTIVRA